MKVLIESSAIIEYLKGNREVKEIIDKSEEFYISSISVFEVLIGRIEERKVMDFLSAFKVLNVSKRDSIMGSRIYKRLRDKGKNVGSFDVLISAQAMNRGLTIVTKDTDFLRVREELHDLNLVMITG